MDNDTEWKIGETSSSSSRVRYFQITLEKVWTSRFYPTNYGLKSRICMPKNHCCCPILTFQTWQSSKSFMRSFKECLIFHPATSFPADAKLQAYRYFHCRCLRWAPQIFKAWNHYSSSTECNQSHFLCIQFVRRKFHSDSIFCQELLLCETDSRVEIPLNTSFLTLTSQGLFAIYPSYSHNFY